MDSNETPEPKVSRPHYIEKIMDALGSWLSMAIMAIVSLVWFGWDKHRHIGTDKLDLAISVWTMLLDVLVIIGANYTRRSDRKLLKSIHAMVKDIHISSPSQGR